MSTTAKIYVPKGRAREYSPYALNHYIGCDHGCSYCYGPASMRLSREEYAVPRMRPLPKTLSADGQVLLSFACDPYSRADAKTWHTRAALKLLLESNTPVAILSKGGNRILRDLDLFREFGDRIMVGQTLTMTGRLPIWQQIEPGTASPKERMSVFQTLKNHGIKTWLSLEPVIHPGESIDVLGHCLGRQLVDVFKIGKMNHGDTMVEINWKSFLENVIAMFDIAGHSGYYIKTDLRPYAEGLGIDPIHFDPDAWVVPFKHEGEI